MKGIYLGAFMAQHPGYDIVYQDINGKRDLPGDMLDVDLTNFDFVIATPPCNYYSRANYRRDSSDYSLNSKHLLPDILNKLSKSTKFFIVENVRNRKMFSDLGLFDFPGIYVYFVGRHTYWTNVKLDSAVLCFYDFLQKPNVVIVNGKKKYLSSQNLPRNKRQGTKEVHDIIEYWLYVLSVYYEQN